MNRSSEDDRPHSGFAKRNLPEDLDERVAHRGETQQQNVRGEVANELRHGQTVTCLAHDDQTGLGFKEPPEAVSKNGMLLGEDDPNGV
jgi:hypothetical protein